MRGMGGGGVKEREEEEETSQTVKTNTKEAQEPVPSLSLWNLSERYGEADPRSHAWSRTLIKMFLGDLETHKTGSD